MRKLGTVKLPVKDLFFLSGLKDITEFMADADPVHGREYLSELVDPNTTTTYLLAEKRKYDVVVLILWNPPKLILGDPPVGPSLYLIGAPLDDLDKIAFHLNGMESNIMLYGKSQTQKIQAEHYLAKAFDLVMRLFERKTTLQKFLDNSKN